jgi:ribonuclease HII
MQWPDFQLETTLLLEGFSPIVGVDEVGRGPLAGPVTAAAVILNSKNLPLGVADSKALNAKHRDAAFESIIERALAISISFVTAAEIDRINIRQASLLAMRRAIDGLSLKPSFALIDGRDSPELDCPARAIIKGDATVLSIAAASIVAKVARDGMMRRLAALYPDYGFETNVGYGAKRHLEALKRLGPTPFHRFSFAPLRGCDGAQRLE